MSTKKRSHSSSASSRSSSASSRSGSVSRSSRSSRSRSKGSGQSRSSSVSSSSSGSSARSNRSKSRSSRSSRSYSRSPSPRGRRSRSRGVKHTGSLKRKSVSPFSVKPTKLFVGRLSKNVSKDHVQEIFSNYGIIKQVEMPTHPIHAHISRGWAYVEFEKSEDAEKAIKYMDGGQIDGQIIGVSIAVGPRKRPFSKGGRDGWRKRSPRRGRRSPRNYRGRSPRRSRSPVRRRRSSSRSSSR